MLSLDSKVVWKESLEQKLLQDRQKCHGKVFTYICFFKAVHSFSFLSVLSCCSNDVVSIQKSMCCLEIIFKNEPAVFERIDIIQFYIIDLLALTE